MILVYIILGIVLFLALTAGCFQLRLRLRGHPGISREDFIQEFRGRGVADDISGRTYDLYKSDSLWKPFGVLPGDTLRGFFGRADEDINDDAAELMRDLNISFPPERILREWNKPLETVSDMVLWLDWIRQHQGGARTPNTTIP